MPDDRRCCPTCHVPEPHACECEPEHEDPDALIDAEFIVVRDRYNPDGVTIRHPGRWGKAPFPRNPPVKGA